MPGELDKIIREAATAIVEDLDDKLKGAEEEARRLPTTFGTKSWIPIARGSQLQKKVARVAGKFQKEVVSLNRRLGKAMKQFKDPLAELVGEIKEHISNYSPDIPERPSPDDYEIEIDESAALFDSNRDPDFIVQYLKQLDAFQQYQAAIDAVMPKTKPKRKGE